MVVVVRDLNRLMVNSDCGDQSFCSNHIKVA